MLGVLGYLPAAVAHYYSVAGWKQQEQRVRGAHGSTLLFWVARISLFITSKAGRKPFI